MEKIEENQTNFLEDLEQVKGSINSIKRDMIQVLLALKNIIARQDEIIKVAFEEVTQTIGISSSHQQGHEPKFDPANLTVAQ